MNPSRAERSRTPARKPDRPARMSFLPCAVLAVSMAVGLALDVRAAELFTVDLTVAGKTVTRGFSNAENALRVIDDDRIDDLFPDYMASDPVTAKLDFRGLPVVARFDQGSAKLIFQVPALSIMKEFDGGDRGRSDEDDRDRFYEHGEDDRGRSVDMFVEFMKKEGSGILNRLQRELARVSPVDPIAGNPGSLQSALVERSFEGGAFQAGRPRADDRIGLRVSAGTFKAGDFSGRSVTLPLSYSFAFESDPRKKLRVQLPLTWQDVEGAAVYTATPGVAFTWPVNDRWLLTPAVTWGVTGSVDAASVAQMAGGMVTSRYELPDFPAAGTTLTVGNMVGYVQTLSFSFKGYGFDPGIKNTVLKNGLMIERPIGVALFNDDELALQVSYAHSYFAGTELFMNQYHELALSLGSAWEEVSAVTDEVRLGATYTFGEDYRGVSINFGYKF